MGHTGDHLYGEQLATQGAKISELRSEASNLAGKFAAQIDRLERSKSQIAYAYVVQRTDAFISTARTYLDDARKLLRGTADLADTANHITAPNAPTQ